MSKFRTTAIAIALCASSALAAAPALADNNPCPPGGHAAGVAGRPPPPLRREVQPPMPGYGYMWTPGYWAWEPYAYDYYWTPGVWVLPPAIGLYWTPPWWGWVGGLYVFTGGYWGPFVGFYGGINYGFGYNGFGYAGGYWQGWTLWLQPPGQQLWRRAR